MSEVTSLGTEENDCTMDPTSRETRCTYIIKIDGSQGLVVGAEKTYATLQRVRRIVQKWETKAIRVATRIERVSPILRYLAEAAFRDTGINIGVCTQDEEVGNTYARATAGNAADGGWTTEREQETEAT